MPEVLLSDSTAFYLNQNKFGFFFRIFALLTQEIIVTFMASYEYVIDLMMLIVSWLY